MKIRSAAFFLILALSNQITCPAQQSDEKVLMTVAGRDVQAGEFVRMYNKGLDPATKTDLNTYLGQFTVFKLKVADAIDRGYDTTKAFRDELNGYRTQLAQSYLTDTSIKEKLIRKAYGRSLLEIKASHILISCRPDAPAADTMKAWEKAIGIRKRIMNGEPFEKVARETSDDKSASLNGGNLGYFTVYQMIHPIEEAVYSAKPGTVTMPVRTNFGYHIIRIEDQRPSGGKIKTAHIMKAAPPGSDEAAISRARAAIDSIYSRLKAGESFESLAKKLSDHKESAARGGEMDWFGAGEILPDFSEAAFSIRDTGEYTMPVRSVYGFHIIKLLDRRPPETFEKAKPYLESKLNQSNISLLGKKSLVDKLKKEYSFRVDPSVRQWFITNTDTLILSGKSKYDRTNIPRGDIFSFAQRRMTATGFADYLEEKGKNNVTSDPVSFVDKSVESSADEEIIRYEDSVLESKYPDFRYLMNEFHDGILLFDVSSKEVWNRVTEDSIGLQDFYQKNKNSYLSRDSAAGTQPPSFKDVQAEVISGYQDWLSDEWVRKLREKYQVVINRRVLKEVKKRLGDE